MTSSRLRSEMRSPPKPSASRARRTLAGGATGAPLPPTITAGRDTTTPPPVRVAFTTASAAEAARAPTEQLPPHLAAALDPDFGGAASAREDVSAAMRAIQVTDEELSAAGLGEVAEIHSPAPASAPQPPGVNPERAGSYHMGRKTGVVETARPPIPRPSSAPPGWL